jgi:hypothetical protein
VGGHDRLDSSTSRIHPEPQRRGPERTATRSLRRRDRRRVPPRPLRPTRRCSTISSRSSLLGHTATPSGSDGLPIRTGSTTASPPSCAWDAIDQQHLAPFLYYGIHDGPDLRDVPRKRGRGYDIEALSNRYTSSGRPGATRHQQLDQHTDAASMRCLGFCVSVDHARFMALSPLRPRRIPAAAVWGDSSPRAEREGVAARSAKGDRGRCSRLTCSTRGRRPQRRHGPDAAPDREPRVVPAATRAWLRKAKDKAVLHRPRLRRHAPRELRFDRRYRRVARRYPA